MSRVLASMVVVAGVTAWLGWVDARLAAEQVPGTQAEAKAPAPTAEETEAFARFNQGDFDGALKRLKEIAKKNPDSPPAEVIMAGLFARAGQAANVRKSLEQATVAEPTDPEAYIEMGTILLRDGWVTAADLLYRRGGTLLLKFEKSAKRKDLLMAQTYDGLSMIAEVRGDWAGCQRQLKLWLDYDPKSNLGMQRMAWCVFQEKNPEVALEWLKAAAKDNPKLLTPEAILAGYYQRTGDRDNARKWYLAALKAAPKDVPTHVTVGHWALDTGQLDLAKAQADAAAQLDPDSLDAMMIDGLVAMFQKDYPAAERYFQTAHIHWPHNPAATDHLALALVEQSDEAKKRQALEFATNNWEQSKNTETAATLGWVFYKLGRLDDAERAFEMARSHGQVSPDIAYYMARLEVDRGHEALAKERYLEPALKSTAPFSMRSEAQALLDKLKK